MKIFSLDLSLHAGWCFAEGEQGMVGLPRLVEYGTVDLGRKITDFGSYPYCYVKASQTQIYENIWPLLMKFKPDIIVVEETSKSRAVYSQKILEFLHRDLLQLLSTYSYKELVYLKTGDWRSCLGLSMSKQQKKDNVKLRKAMRAGKVNKKALGIKGLVTPKHVAIAYVNKVFELDFKVKDNNTVDAIALSLSYVKNCVICDGDW